VEGEWAAGYFVDEDYHLAELKVMDAKWLGQRLSMLSEEQIRDGFRAAGWTREEIEMYTQAMRKRIAALAAL
jgi:hypothetical protein